MCIIPDGYVSVESELLAGEWRGEQSQCITGRINNAGGMSSRYITIRTGSESKATSSSKSNTNPFFSFM
jgi:hypothetical protein